MDYKVGLAYNSQATGNKDFLTYRGGETDWLGMDDGTRDLPGAVGKKQSVPPARTITPRPTSPDYQTQVDEANLLNKQTIAMGTTQFRPTTAAPPPAAAQPSAFE